MCIRDRYAKSTKLLGVTELEVFNVRRSEYQEVDALNRSDSSIYLASTRTTSFIHVHTRAYTKYTFFLAAGEKYKLSLLIGFNKMVFCLLYALTVYTVHISKISRFYLIN